MEEINYFKVVFYVAGIIVIARYIIIPTLKLIVESIYEWWYEKYTPEWKKQLDRNKIQYNGFTVIDMRCVTGDFDYRIINESLGINDTVSIWCVIDCECWSGKLKYDAIIKYINNKNL